MTRRNEDLLEAIYEISRNKGYAKSRDIAAALKITPATVTDGFKRLQDAGLVNYEPYGGVTLTKEGLKIAERTTQSHLMLCHLLELAGVDPLLADHDACIMEHGLSKDSYQKLLDVVDFIEEICKDPKIQKLFLKMVLKE
jgi:DtxR family transcriptional regulator, Mn-dependent transcriptional regulator